MQFRAPRRIWLLRLSVGLATGATLAVGCGDDTSATGSGGGAAGGANTSASGATSSSGSPTTGATASTSSGSAASTGGAGGQGQGGRGQGGDGGHVGDGGQGQGAQGGDGGQGGDAGSGASGGGTTVSGGGGAGGGVPVDPARLRIVAANLTSGNLQSYDPGHGIRILKGLAGDVMLVQEMRYGNNTAAALRSFADAVCGASCDVAREPYSGAGDLPNGVVSRHPIVASGFWNDPQVDNRELFWARIDLPGDRDLVAISVHLLTSSAANRDDEAEALIAAMDAEVEPEDLVVLGGDFNTDVREEPALTTLSRVFAVGAPWPVDTTGDGDTSANRSKPYDWVIGDDDLHARAIPVLIGAQSFADGLVVDTRTFTPLADLAPALLNDSGASNMQHMAVVRDFALD